MKTYAAFVRADGIVVLNTVAHVRAYTAFVIYPRHTESVNAVGDAETLNKVQIFKRRILVVFILNRIYHFLNSLKVFWLIGEAAPEVGNKFFCFHLFYLIIEIENRGNKNKSGIDCNLFVIAGAKVQTIFEIANILQYLFAKHLSKCSRKVVF